MHKVIFWALLALAGCGAWAADTASPAVSDQAPSAVVVNAADEALLKERVLARWQALIKGDFEAAYQFETPAYRAIYAPLQFKYQFGNQVMWRAANVISVRYADPEVAKVRVEVLYRYAEAEKADSNVLNTTSQVDESWFRKEGNWWHQQD